MRHWVWLLGILGGCDGATVNGTVDAKEVGGARDAIWDEFEIDLPFVGSISFTQIWISDFSDSCEVVHALADADDDADSCEELCAGYLQVVDDFHLDPEDHWSLYLSANTSDGAVGDFDYADLPDVDEFSAAFTFLRGGDLVDSSTCEAACEDGDLLAEPSDTELGEDGLLTLDEVDDGDLPGEFRIEFGGADVLEGSFHAEPCDLEDL